MKAQALCLCNIFGLLRTEYYNIVIELEHSVTKHGILSENSDVVSMAMTDTIIPAEYGLRLDEIPVC